MLDILKGLFWSIIFIVVSSIVMLGLWGFYLSGNVAEKFAEQAAAVEEQTAADEALTVLRRRWPVYRDHVRTCADLAIDAGMTKTEFAEEYAVFMTTVIYVQWIEEFGTDIATWMIADMTTLIGALLADEYPDWEF